MPLLIGPVKLSTTSKIFAGKLKNVDAKSTLLFQTTFVDLGTDTPDGQIVRAVTVPWRRIVDEIKRNQEFLFEFVNDPRKLEEFVAATYEQDGWGVVLTPRSGDGGRDVIATRRDPTPIRLLDQCKAFSSGHVVTADDIRAMYGVLSGDLNASKAVVTTTSTFAPGIATEFGDRIPYRVELRDGEALAQWLQDVSGGQQTG